MPCCSAHCPLLIQILFSLMMGGHGRDFREGVQPHKPQYSEGFKFDSIMNSSRRTATDADVAIFVLPSLAARPQAEDSYKYLQVVGGECKSHTVAVSWLVGSLVGWFGFVKCGPTASFLASGPALGGGRAGEG